MEASDSTTVEIFGQTYNVRGEGDPNYLAELARFVDSRMREVAAEVATVDPVKIAILAALNIADEFSRFKKQSTHTAQVGSPHLTPPTARASRQGRSSCEYHRHRSDCRRRADWRGHPGGAMENRLPQEGRGASRRGAPQRGACYR